MARGAAGARRAARRTRGYRHHPQLERFQRHASPLLAVDAYLAAVHDEATRRGYTFDRSKIGAPSTVAGITASTGQLAYEWEHLLRKLAVRTPCSTAGRDETPTCHPLFLLQPGPMATWERP